ncbi:MAG: HlyD family efflux transporter periplasmic adaptor subunit [Planctomycetales bacterium]|nr:HlyD family efflux transporter periplasmic adaptor subunit [Planctomycetales bacterium]
MTPFAANTGAGATTARIQPRRRLRTFPTPVAHRPRVTPFPAAVSHPVANALDVYVPRSRVTPAPSATLPARLRSGPAARAITFTLVATVLALFVGYRATLYFQAVNAVRGEIAFLSSSTDGVVADVLVRDGEWVEAGQPLLEVTDASVTAEVESVENELRLVESQLASARATARWSPTVGGADIEQLTNQAQQLSNKLDELRQQTEYRLLVAPCNGRVLRMNRFTGEQLHRGEMVIEFLPET